MPVVKINGLLILVEEDTQNLLLAELCERYVADATDLSIKLKLLSTEQGIVCEWNIGAKKPLRLGIDIDKFVVRQSSFPAPRKGVFNQAIGRRTKTVLDATGGWGSDALLLCSQGYRVEILERHPLMALLLQDAMHRLARSRWARLNRIAVPRVHHGPAEQYLSRPELMQFDCIYVDPMFPPKRKTSAATAKEIQFLQWLPGTQDDAQGLADAASRTAIHRVVIKRPHHATALLENPSERFSGKLVHYDVYLNNLKHL